MARARIQRVATKVSWAASGAISQELSPIPFTTTGLLVVVHLDISTTATPTHYNDALDRMISRLNLTGIVNNQQKTFFDFSNLRIAHHDTRFELGKFAPRRPAMPLISQTNFLMQYAYYFHFGVQPFNPDGTFNWLDMTGGLPKVGTGQLSIGGTFGAAAAMGSGDTINATSACYLEFYLCGVQDEAGDDPLLYTPRAFPVWSQRTPTPTATSTTFGTSDNVPGGAHLRSILLMMTNGSNAPRDWQMLTDLRLYNQKYNYPIIEFGGRGTAVDAGGADYRVAEIFSQMRAGLTSAPPSEDLDRVSGYGSSTVLPLGPGVPAITGTTDPGLVHFPLYKLTTRVHPLYGADLRNIDAGDIKFDYGVGDATGVTMDHLYKRWELNPNHPANAAPVPVAAK